MFERFLTSARGLARCSSSLVNSLAPGQGLRRNFAEVFASSRGGGQPFVQHTGTPWSSHLVERSFVRHNSMMPRRLKYKKAQMGYFKVRQGGSRTGTAVILGEYGLVAKQGSRITAKQLEHCRQVIRRAVRPFKGASVVIRVFTDRPVTSKGIGIRMGKGKGQVDFYAKWVAKDTVLFELKSGQVALTPDGAKRALAAAAHSLPMPCKVVTKQESLQPLVRQEYNGYRDPNTVDLRQQPVVADSVTYAPRALPPFIANIVREKQQMERIESRRQQAMGL